MGGTAILDPNVLIDSLVVDVIDSLRGSLHPQFGVRPYKVYAVKRTWTGPSIGAGKMLETSVEITPQPRISQWDGLELDLNKCGLSDVGQIKLTEVSLTYTYNELTGGDLNANQQFLIKVGEAYGQGQPDRYFRHAKPPFVDREKNMGWVLWLNSAEVPR